MGDSRRSLCRWRKQRWKHQCEIPSGRYAGPYHDKNEGYFESDHKPLRSVQGFKLQEGGIASSINMSTLTYKTWKMFNGKLLLTSVSEGSGSPEEGTDTFSIKTLGPDSLVVSNSETTFEYT